MIIDKIKSHFDKYLSCGLDVYGAEQTAMWMASVDIKTGRYPHDDTRPADIGKRVYRYIDAPRGCNFYWDQPALAAAEFLSRLTGERSYREAVDNYTSDFFDRCVAHNGMLLWGNHYYYDAFRDTVVNFGGKSPEPIDFNTEKGHQHEMRPIVPAWHLMWEIVPQEVENAILTAVEGHIVDENTGEFQRHAGGKRGCAFLEAGGVLVDSLAWLYTKSGEEKLKEDAESIANFSFHHRNPHTGLLENDPTVTRWDKYISTTEVGLWAGAMLRASRHFDHDAFAKMGAAALKAYLRWGFDEDKMCYYGRLSVSDGKPVMGEKTTLYQPEEYSDLWEPLFPTHDYPLAMAEATLEFYKHTGDSVFQQACERWKQFIEHALPARGGRGAYAEQYGRCIHFLMNGYKTLGDDSYYELAGRVAEEAVDKLFEHDMFRTHPGEDRYDSVDGVGFFFCALLWFESGYDPISVYEYW